MTFPMPVTGKAHQRKIRESQALLPDPLLAEKRALAVSFKNATVREIPYQTAKEFIVLYEWLGNMGTTDVSFGLYFGEHLAAVEFFGRTAGTKTAASVCGPEYANMVKTVCRGACAHWAHPHSASYLISAACRLMSERGFHIFVAYSDAEAGEIGTVYQACNWLHCEPTKQGSSLFVWSGKKGKGFKDGKERDERNIQHAVRSRRFKGQPIAAYQIKCTRREARERMVKEGFLFLKATPKRRYVGFYGDRRLVRELRAALRWNEVPYPKRTVEGHPDGTPIGSVVRSHESAPNLTEEVSQK
jgi:hypothetical protein